MSSESIEKVRQLFEAELVANSGLYHPVDIERVRSEEWQVKRFLLYHPESEPQVAFEGLCKALKWKKAFGLHERDDLYFPREFWEMAGAEITGRDKKGRIIHWGAVRNLRTYKETQQAVFQFMAHIMERVDRIGGELGFIIVLDNNGGQLVNMSIENAKFVLGILEFYPLGLKRVYSVDLPWILRAVTNFIISLMGAKMRELFHVVDSASLVDDIDEVHIPVGLKGGLREKKIYPSGLVPLVECYERFNLDEKFVAKFLKTINANNNNNNNPL